MGSYSYDRDVYSSSSYSNWGSSSYSASKLSASTLDKSVNPKGKVIESNSKNPIIIVLDVTGSNINFARLVYDKLPMFYGEIEQKGYLEDFDLCICAVGDATCDDYPIQIGSPAKGLEIDSWMEKLVLESGGGGQKKESYELMAHYLINNTKFRKDANPIVFFIADEKPYDYVKKCEAEEIGSPIQEEYNPWPELNKKFKDNVFVMLNKYCGRYFDQDIANKWKSILPPEHTLRIPEEKAIVDLMLGVIAIQKQELEDYAVDMLNRGQTKQRIEGVKDSLQRLSNSTEISTHVDTNLPSQLKLTKSNKGKRI
jgi:hypothetical protein